MAAAIRRSRRRVIAAFTVPIVIGLAGVSMLPAYGFAPSASAAIAMASPAGGSGSQQALLAPLAASVEQQGERDGFSSESVQQQREERATSYRAAMAKVSRFIGDDYPFSGEPDALSPLSYALLNCTDFVAWRLNRDAGSTRGPWLMPWSYLTPAGGNAYQWKANWDAHGWIVSAVPVVGSVAWFPGANHVAYVAAVRSNGTVLIEEYNYNVRYTYGTRAIATRAALYLYPPPLPGSR